MSLRSPLSRVLGMGSAKDGTGHWWSQRVSAVALLVLGLWFLIAIMTMPGYAHSDVLQLVEKPFNAVMLILLCLTLAYHSNLGVQVVVEDYIDSSFSKVATLILVKFVHVFFGIAAVFAVLKIAVGATS